jgi:hypothetical protein
MHSLGLEVFILAIGVPFVNGELVGARSREQSFNWNSFGSIQSLRPFVWRLGTGPIVIFLSLKFGDATQGCQTTLVFWTERTNFLRPCEMVVLRL